MSFQNKRLVSCLIIVSVLFFGQQALSQSAIPDDKCAIITGATKDPKVALKAVEKFKDYVPVVIESSNGYLAPSLGIYHKDGAKELVEEFKKDKIIPDDAYCGNADRFVSVLYPDQNFTALSTNPPSLIAQYSFVGKWSADPNDCSITEYETDSIYFEDYSVTFATKSCDVKDQRVSPSNPLGLIIGMSCFEEGEEYEDVLSLIRQAEDKILIPDIDLEYTKCTQLNELPVVATNSETANENSEETNIIADLNKLPTIEGQGEKSETNSAKIIPSSNETFCNDPNTPARCLDMNFGNGLVRVLTSAEFKNYFDGKVFKTGSQITGSSVEFMLDFSLNEYTFLQSDGKKTTKRFEIWDDYQVCFNRGSGPCVDGGFAIVDAENNPLTGVLKDTFVILGVARQGDYRTPPKDTFLDCGIDYIQDGKIALPRDCYLGKSGKFEKLIGRDEDIHLEYNEIAYISDSAAYFDSDAVKRQGENEVIANLANFYATYRYWDLFCGESVSLDEMQSSLSIIFEGVLAETPKDTHDSLKDVAWENSERVMQEIDGFNMNKQLFGAMSSSDRTKACTEAVKGTMQQYRLIANQVKDALDEQKPKEKKKRKF